MPRRGRASGGRRFGHGARRVVGTVGPVLGAQVVEVGAVLLPQCGELGTQLLHCSPAAVLTTLTRGRSPATEDRWPHLGGQTDTLVACRPPLLETASSERFRAHRWMRSCNASCNTAVA